MEYVMDGPGSWQFELVSYWGDFPYDFEGSMVLGG